MPRVSIITPVYNSANFVAETIKSVQAQTFVDWELILVDDLSSDGSLEILQRFASDDQRIRVLTLSKNSGASVARNLAIQEAKGRYIAFLDSDDKWAPHKLEAQIRFMQINNNYPFIYSSYYKTDEVGNLLGCVEAPARVSYRELLKTCSIGCLTVVYDTEFFGKVYMPAIEKRMDYGLWLSLLKRCELGYGLREALGYYRVRSGSISSNKFLAAGYTWKLYFKVERLGFARSVYYFSQYAVRSTIRNKFPRFAKFIGLFE